MRTRSQSNALEVYEQIKAIEGWQQDKRKQYGALCHRFPVMILNSGLAQAMGFLCAKAQGEDGPERAHTTLVNHLTQLLGGRAQQAISFQREIVALDLGEYQRLTRNALEAAVWYKRYAESILKVQAGGDS